MVSLNGRCPGQAGKMDFSFGTGCVYWASACKFNLGRDEPIINLTVCGENKHFYISLKYNEQKNVFNKPGIY
jgi:hypothetical protein